MPPRKAAAFAPAPPTLPPPPTSAAPPAPHHAAEGAARVRVAVRVRPMSRQETAHGAGCCVGVVGNTLTLVDPVSLEMAGGAGSGGAAGGALAGVMAAGAGGAAGGGATLAALTIPKRVFSFDHVYARAAQERVYTDVGAAVLANALAGFNSSLFAYGQTGSGKSYTMMGTSGVLDPGSLGAEIGLIPRICCALFDAVAAAEEAEDAAVAAWTQRRARRLVVAAAGGGNGRGAAARSLNVSFEAAGARRKDARGAALDGSSEGEGEGAGEGSSDEEGGSGSGGGSSSGSTHTAYSITVSYLEIYCERVRDLFALEDAAAAVGGGASGGGGDGGGSGGRAQSQAGQRGRRKSANSTVLSMGSAAEGRGKGSGADSGSSAGASSGAAPSGSALAHHHLRVREHPTKGAYVEGLREVAVTSYADVEKLLVAGR
jgi:hypothetical protein